MGEARIGPGSPTSHSHPPLSICASRSPCLPCHQQRHGAPLTPAVTIPDSNYLAISFPGVQSALYGLILSLVICVAAVAVFTTHILLLLPVLLSILGKKKQSHCAKLFLPLKLLGCGTAEPPMIWTELLLLCVNSSGFPGLNPDVPRWMGETLNKCTGTSLGKQICVSNSQCVLSTQSLIFV